MKRIAGYVLAALLLPFAFVIHVLLRAWEAWHYGPSQWILSALRWLNYKAFKKPAAYVRRLVDSPKEGKP